MELKSHEKLKKTDFRFWKWHEEFGKISPEHLKVSKLGIWWHHFVRSWKFMSLKLTGQLCVMLMKNNAKIEEELTFQFKIDIGISQSLTWVLESFKNVQFKGLLLTKQYNLCAKKIQRSYIWWHWILMQSLKENWLVLSEMTWRIRQIFFYGLKNSNFILESKKAELNQNQNLKQPDRPVAVWKLYFTLGINK